MRRYRSVISSTANAPTAPASVGVAMPARMTPSVAKMTTTTGAMPNTSSRTTSPIDPARSSSGSAGPSAGIEIAPHQRVDDVEQRQHQPGDDRGGEEIGRRNADHRPHHDQHDRRRDQDAERAAGGDGAGRHADVVAGALHRRRRHHAQQRHRRADDARRRGEDRRRQQHREVQRAAHGREAPAGCRETAAPSGPTARAGSP